MFINTLTFEEHIQRLIKELKKKLYFYSHILHFQFLIHIFMSSYFQKCPTTSELIEPIARLYNRAYKIHLKLSSWTHHCVVLSQSKLFNFYNYTVLSCIHLYYQLYYHLFPYSLCYILPRHNSIRLGRITRAITNEMNPIPAFNNNYDLK